MRLIFLVILLALPVDLAAQPARSRPRAPAAPAADSFESMKLPSRYAIMIQLSTERGRAFKHRAPISDSDYQAALMDLRRGTAAHVIAAKQAMAEESGYTKARYGADNWKMLSDPEVVSIVLWDKEHKRAKNFPRPFEVRRRGNR